MTEGSEHEQGRSVTLATLPKNARAWAEGPGGTGEGGGVYVVPMPPSTRISVGKPDVPTLFHVLHCIPTPELKTQLEPA